MPKKPHNIVARAARMRALLKVNGHKPDKVDKLKMGSKKELAESVMQSHGLTLDDLRRALNE